MKILINCPGGWSHGLDSPERGEGRWAQNIARCLSQRPDIEVYATSGGDPTWGRGDVAPVHLLHEAQARDHGPYDLYFDASWWEGKPALAEAKHYFHVYWDFRPRHRDPLPENHHTVYVYATAAGNYAAVADPSKLHYLPVPFAKALRPPAPGNHRVLIPIRGGFGRDSISGLDPNNDARCRIATTAWSDAAEMLRRRFPDLVTVTVGNAFLKEIRADIVLPPATTWGIPYNEMKSEMLAAGLNVPILAAPGCAPDCSVLGVPTLLGPRTWPVLEDVARPFTRVWMNEVSPQAFLNAATALFEDDDLYVKYTLALQNLYADHIDSRVLELFDQLVGRL